MSFLLREFHDAMYSGHVGVTKTYKRVQVNFWWPEMQGSIRSYINLVRFAKGVRPLLLNQQACYNHWRFLINVGT